MPMATAARVAVRTSSLNFIFSLDLPDFKPLPGIVPGSMACIGQELVLVVNLEIVLVGRGESAVVESGVSPS